MTEPKTYNLDVPGAVLTYDVRSSGESTEPILLMVGSPMGAAGFNTLAGHFTDRTIVTYDPRGVERSTRTDTSIQSTPDVHADDLHRLIDELGSGPVDIFASSGGADKRARCSWPGTRSRCARSWRTSLRPRRCCRIATRLAAVRDIDETYKRDGMGPAMAKFIVMVMHQGRITADYIGQPAPDPATFGLPTEDDGSRDDVLLGQNLVTCLHYEIDFDALQAASTRLVIGVGAESQGELAHRAGEAVAQRLGTTAVTFPSNHGGFLGGEYGQTGEPDAFAGALREVLPERR